MRAAAAAVAVATCGVALLVSGCASPEPADLRYAQQARARIAAVLDGWAEAIRDKDVARALSFTDPKMGPGRRAKFDYLLPQLIRMARYAGYRIESREAAAAASWKALKAGRVQLRAWCTNRDGARFRERYWLARRDERWYVEDVAPTRWRKVERADLPPEEVEGIRPVVRFVIENLRAGKPGRVYALLPDDETAHYRELDPYAPERLLGGVEGRYSIYEDLQIMQEFEIKQWPDPEGELPLYFLAPTVVEVRYAIPYTWAEGGIYRTDVLKLRLVIVQDRGVWRLHKIRLYGKGIEYSE